MFPIILVSCLAFSTHGGRLSRSRLAREHSHPAHQKPQKCSTASDKLHGTAKAMHHASSPLARLLRAINPRAAFKFPLRGAHASPSFVGNPTPVDSQAVKHRRGFPVMNPPGSQAAEVTATADTSEDPWEDLVRMCEERMKPPFLPPARFEEVPRLLRKVLDDDFQQLLSREKKVQKLTCMRPRDEDSGFGVYGKDATSVPLCPGRDCRGGKCTDVCSRVTFPVFATRAEVDAFRKLLDNNFLPENLWLETLIFNGNVRLLLTSVRILERMRRAIAHEYELDLSHIRPITHLCPIVYHRADYFKPTKPNMAHSDESVVDGAHYSSVFYMTTQNEDFKGGTFYWNDPPEQKEGEESNGQRTQSPVSPQAGMAFVLSSGWENMHYFTPITSGFRVSMPAFFTTHPYSRDEDDFDDDYMPEFMKTDAETLWRSLLKPNTLDDFNEFKEKWNDLLVAE